MKTGYSNSLCHRTSRSPSHFKLIDSVAERTHTGFSITRRRKRWRSLHTYSRAITRTARSSYSLHTCTPVRPQSTRITNGAKEGTSTSTRHSYHPTGLIDIDWMDALGASFILAPVRTPRHWHHKEAGKTSPTSSLSSVVTALSFV